MQLSRLFYALVHGCFQETRPQHLAVGITLGVALGGFPLVTPQWWLALGLCLVLRCQIVAVFTGAAVAGLTVFALAEPLQWLGWRVLIPVPNLHGFWAWLYHSPFIPFTHFNETFSMGRNLLTALALPLVYTVTLRQSRKWEVPLNAWIQETLGALHWRAEHCTLPPEQSLSKAWVRPQARWILGGIGVLCIAWYLVAFESWFRKRLEASATALNAAPVKIRDLDFDLIDRRMTLKGVELAHHTKENTNRFEVDEVVVEFMATPLLYRKFVIKNLYVKGLHSNTFRSRWEEGPMIPDTAVSSLIDRVATGVLRGMRGDSHRSPFNALNELKGGMNLSHQVSQSVNQLKTFHRLEEIRAEWARLESAWSEALDALPDSQWFTRMGWSAETRQPAAESPPEVQKMKADVVRVRTRIENDYGSLSRKLTELHQSLPEDVLWMRDRLNIPDLSNKDLTWVVFGSEVLNYLERMAYWVDASRRFMPPAFDQSRIPISIHGSEQGEVIHFHQGGGFATFLLINGELTSQRSGPNSVLAKGALSGFTTNPSGWALPARLQLDASFPKGLDRLKLDIAVDHTSTSPRETVRLDFEGLNVENLSLHRGPDLEFHLDSPKASGFLLASFSEDSLNAEWNVEFAQSRFEVSSPYPELAQTLENASKSLYTFRMKGRMEGPLDRLHVEAESELGEAVAVALRHQYRHALGAVDDNIVRYVREHTEPGQRELESRLEAAYRTAQERLTEVETRLKSL